MGRPVIDALSKTNHYTLRVLTRNAQGEQAKNLTKTYPNVELVEGNYADEQAVRKLLTSVYGVFCNTDCWNCGGFQNEVDYGKMIFDISKELNVKHFVYSSLDHTQKLMANHGGYRCYHYDGKALVAEYIESHDPNNSDQLTFTLPMADKPIVLVGIDDIAWFVKYSFENPDKSFGEIFYIAGDNITMNDLVRTFTEVTGIQAKYNPVSLDQYVEKIDFDQKEDFIGFYQQFLREQVKRDFNAVKAIHPGLLNWRKWLEKTGWKGEQVVIQTSNTYYKKN